MCNETSNLSARETRVVSFSNLLIYTYPKSRCIASSFYLSTRKKSKHTSVLDLVCAALAKPSSPLVNQQRIATSETTRSPSRRLLSFRRTFSSNRHTDRLNFAELRARTHVASLPPDRQFPDARPRLSTRPENAGSRSPPRNC